MFLSVVVRSLGACTPTLYISADVFSQLYEPSFVYSRLSGGKTPKNARYVAKKTDRRNRRLQHNMADLLVSRIIAIFGSYPPTETRPLKYSSYRWGAFFEFCDLIKYSLSFELPKIAYCDRCQIKHLIYQTPNVVIFSFFLESPLRKPYTYK